MIDELLLAKVTSLSPADRLELIGVVSILLLYLPFAIKDWRTTYLLNRDNASRLESISK